MRFEFATAARIVFGAGAFKEIGSIATGFGRHALVVSSQGGADPAALMRLLAERNLLCSPYSFRGEPAVDQVVEGVKLASQNGCDFLIGFGGGSAMDMAKAIAAMLTNPGELLDYLEVIGRGKTLSQPAAPVIAIPTTAGTGAEVTRNAVLAAPEQRFKASLLHPSMLPRVALVDPELTYSLPAPVTASTGMDALTQVIEPYVSVRANPLTDALCKEGVQRAARSLGRAYEHGEDAAAREDMALASLFGGLALANAGLGAVHGFASPLGGTFNAPHGAICARLLPSVFEVNVRALQMRQPQNPALERYGEVAQWLTGSPAASVNDGVRWLNAHPRIGGVRVEAFGFR
jgi:alcohol dehydrogenase class IV